MHVGVLKIDFHIADSTSLKAKRSVLRHLKDVVRKNFNVSISEVDNHDKWQLASLGISCIANDKRHINTILSHVENFFEKNRNIVVTDSMIEII
ncbi:MAG: hypothetical protein A2Y81_08740 [Nitrospirae bacterium RBG_13_43_8]|nr:MAG: hypothetical protein A2Y81_08740 [Nitrospirae bacterium RBG_13_43_8]